MAKSRFALIALVTCWLALAVLGAEVGQKVDINQASAAELDRLPGIGPAIAGRIIDFRNKNGPFRRLEDIMNVRGIGEKKFLKLKDLISVSAPAKALAPPGSKTARK